jgi:hypothetical protein
MAEAKPTRGSARADGRRGPRTRTGNLNRAKPPQLAAYTVSRRCRYSSCEVIFAGDYRSGNTAKVQLDASAHKVGTTRSSQARRGSLGVTAVPGFETECLHRRARRGCTSLTSHDG